MARPTDWYDVFGFGDPTPGSVFEIRQVGSKWSGVADKAGYAKDKLSGWLRDGSVATWIGKAGEAFATHSSELPDQLAKTEKSYQLASDAMYWWANRLDLHQGKADGALVKGREAKADIASAQAALNAANGQVSSAGNASALNYDGPADGAPTSQQIQDAQGKLNAANAAKTKASNDLHGAEGRLEAARKLALEAKSLRIEDGKTAAGKIHDAADAGIKPRSRWQKFKDGVSKAWDVLVEIAKIVVVVLGVVALIIGGPLAWVVFAASLILLADAIMKYAKGQATLLDVLMAAVGCIPGTKGLTTLSALSSAFKAGGVIGATAHVLSSGATAVKGLMASVKSIATVTKSLKSGLVPGLKAAIEVVGNKGITNVLPELKTTIREMTTAFKGSLNETRLLVQDAQNWQGIQKFPGVDDYTGVRLPSGTNLEVGFPGVSNYAMPGGTAAAHGGSASGVWEGVQVGPNGAGFAHEGYRGSLIELQVHNPINAATGTTLANPAYGAGGTQQYFFNITDQIAAGNVHVLDGAGGIVHIPEGTTGSQVNGILSGHFGNSGTIHLSGAGSPNPGILSQQEVAGLNSHLPTQGPQHAGLYNVEIDVPSIMSGVAGISILDTATDGKLR